MREREVILAKLWELVAATSGVGRTARNPVTPPNENDMPCINLFELDDLVDSSANRGASQYPAYKRTLSVVIEVFASGSSEAAATKALGLFVQEMKKKIYQYGVSLGLANVEVLEESAGRILHPPDMERTVGIGISLRIKYVEDVSKLFS